MTEIERVDNHSSVEKDASRMRASNRKFSQVFQVNNNGPLKQNARGWKSFCRGVEYL